MSDTTPSSERRPALEPSVRAFLDALAGRPAPAGWPPGASDRTATNAWGRERGEPGEGPADLLADLAETRLDDASDTTAEWLALPGGPTGRVRVQVVRPAGAAEPVPVVLFLHGLGWALGDADSYGRILREFAVGADAAVVFVDYDRAPGARYPVAVEQCWAVARWIRDHGRELGLDGERMAVAGDSSGANLVAAVTLLARRHGPVPLLHQVLICPVTDADFDTPSYREYAEGYLLHREDMRRYWDAYLPDLARRHEATAAPLRASLDQLAGLPPALVITAEADVLRDEGEAYAARLRAAGVPVVATRYQGVVHGFVLLDACRHAPTARAALIQAVDTLHVALHRWPG
ncbi:alpha/beta hydrolase fold domain-containing protein [Kitasatospora hibisci]|uniref:alpha/beta hydrolase fold domain-containing protein n=1 Tax=Kitasatospora hibisci TaxID=3369522 RepID=UPI0037541F14